MQSIERHFVVGTFEYIEAKIRRDAEGTTFGGDFEWLCQWFLENAPRYRDQFDQVWLWKDWPERWGTDAGIDLVARTRTGELWAIQAKADHPDRAMGRHSSQDFDTLVVCSDDSVLQSHEDTRRASQTPLGLSQGFNGFCATDRDQSSRAKAVEPPAQGRGRGVGAKYVVRPSEADTALQSTADLGVKVTTKPTEIQQFLDQASEAAGRRVRHVLVIRSHRRRIPGGRGSRQPRPFDLVICDEAHRLAGHAEGLFATILDGKKIKASKRLFMTATPRYFQEHVKRRAAELEFELVPMDDAHVFGPEFHVLTFHEAISAKPEPLLTDDQVVVIGVTDREAKAWAERATLVRIPARRGSNLARRGANLARRGSIPARRGSPDPAETPDRRSPLRAIPENQSQRGDLRSNHSAGSGGPRTVQEFTTDARTLAAQIGLARRCGNTICGSSSRSTRRWRRPRGSSMPLGEIPCRE